MYLIFMTNSWLFFVISLRSLRGIITIYLFISDVMILHITQRNSC